MRKYGLSHLNARPAPTPPADGTAQQERRFRNDRKRRSFFCLNGRSGIAASGTTKTAAPGNWLPAWPSPPRPDAGTAADPAG